MEGRCDLVESAPSWDGTGCEFDSRQCRIYLPCSLSLRLLGSLRRSLGSLAWHKICVKKIRQNCAGHWIWKTTVNTAIFFYINHEPRICGNIHQDLSDSTNPAWDMEGHANHARDLKFGDHPSRKQQIFVDFCNRRPWKCLKRYQGQFDSMNTTRDLMYHAKCQQISQMTSPRQEDVSPRQANDTSILRSHI